jgi:creatinine amidohydrolase/Fe(II)-dependent formamide hydrolase-like protein
MAEPSLHAARVHFPFPAERYLGYLTADQVRSLDKEHAAAVLVIGAIEQHGPHLPIATDLILGVSMLALAAERLNPSVELWILPPLAYGRSVEHEDFAGTVTLSQETLVSFVLDVAASVARSGFRRLVLFNSHGGNVSVLETVARDARRATGLMVFPFSMFRIGLDVPPYSEEEGRLGTHAGEWETSMMLALTPELVDTAEAAATTGYVAFDPAPEHLSLLGPIPFAWVTADISATGAIGDPSRASVERGREIIERSVEKIARAFEEICRFEMPTPAGRGATPPTADEVPVDPEEAGS